MKVGTFIAIYFIIWWVVLFAVLPWGVRSQEESGEVTPALIRARRQVIVWAQAVMDNTGSERGVCNSVRGLHL